MSWSPIQIWPMVGWSSPATILSVVVLPHPEGPSSAKNEPRGMTRSSCSTAVKFSYRFVTPFSFRSPEVFPVTNHSPRHDRLELAVVLGLLGRSQTAEDARTGNDFRRGEDQRVGGGGRVALQQHRLRTLDRRDVVDVVHHLGHDSGVVVVVDHRLCVLLVPGQVGDHEVVRPVHEALLRQGIAEVWIVRLELDDVAGPGQAGRGIAGGQGLGVVVAGESLDLPGVLGPLCLLYTSPSPRDRTRSRM